MFKKFFFFRIFDKIYRYLNYLKNKQTFLFFNIIYICILYMIKGLDVSGNFFRHVESRMLLNLPSLRRLDISENAIALVEPDAFLNTPSLEHVNLSGNALSVLHPMTFRHLTNLYELDVGWNRLLEIIPGKSRIMLRMRHVIIFFFFF